MAIHEELLESARSQTGLDQFGEPSFLEGLEILATSLRDEARLNALGKQVLRRRIVDHLKQRLHVEDWYRRHPEIENVVITAPLIGVSLPRTGSTALSFLLAQDPQARSLLRWESAQPCPPPATVEGPDPRIAQAGVATRPAAAQAHVPSSATGPAECQELMALDFKSHLFQAFAQVPSYSEWLLDADLGSTYRYERRVLKLLQWRCPARPWRLKCPTHLLFLDHLDQVFPDARFVMTHRDPSEVLPSVAYLYADYVGKFTDQIDVRYLGALNLKHWSVGMQRALAFRGRGHGHRFYDIGFRAMQQDPVGAVRGLYAWLGEPVSTDFAVGMARWWNDNAASHEPALRPEATIFGLEPERVRPLFETYMARTASWTHGAA